MKPAPVTLVIFRRWRGRFNDSVFAMFPELPSDAQAKYCDSYATVGQHGGADYHGCIAATDPAAVTEPDVAKLYRELTKRGYRLKVINRASQAMHERRKQAARDYAKPDHSA